ncbi:MAG TPA: hypothetical protein VF251_01650 [Pyrinomonadaceae bacterium]
MRNSLSSALSSYREFRAAKARNKPYKIVRGVLLLLTGAFVLLLSFPQLLFAHQTTYKNFHVYSRAPLDQNINTVLDKVEARLATSSIKDDNVRPRVFLTNSYGLYRGLSLNIGWNSFGKGYALLPTSNVFINKADLASDTVFREAPTNNARSLSGVIAHEVTHLLIRNRYGYWRNVMMPAWKKEGYAEYVGGGTTLSYEEGVKMWKSNPKDGTGYQYFKYYTLVKYLLEQDKLSVDDLFNREFDVAALEEKVLKTL